MSELTVDEALNVSKNSLDWILQSHILLSQIRDYSDKNEGGYNPQILEAQRQELLKTYVPPSRGSFGRFSLDLIPLKDADPEVRQTYRDIESMLSYNYDFLAKWVEENKRELEYNSIEG